MKFSVTIPAYKPEFLQEAIESVQSQSYPDWELIIVDDCSPADLQSIVAPFLKDSRVSYYRNEKNFGAVDVVDNWNRCLEYCTGDYVICMGDDDRLRPDCLRELARAISEHPYYGVYHVRTELIDEKGKVIECLESRPQFESSLEMLLRRWEGRRQFIGDFCFNRQGLKTNGGFFKLPLGWGSDDITVYLASKGGIKGMKDGIVNVDTPLFQYRRNLLTISSSSKYKQKLQAMHASSDWFENELNERINESDDERLMLEQLKILRAQRYADYAKFYVRQDVHANPHKLWFWLLHNKESRLPFFVTLIQTIKGLVK